MVGQLSALQRPVAIDATQNPLAAAIQAAQALAQRPPWIVDLDHIGDHVAVPAVPGAPAVSLAATPQAPLAPWAAEELLPLDVAAQGYGCTCGMRDSGGIVPDERSKQFLPRGIHRRFATLLTQFRGHAEHCAMLLHVELRCHVHFFIDLAVREV